MNLEYQTQKRKIKFRAWDEKNKKMHYQLVKPRTNENIENELIIQFDCTGYSARTKNKLIGSDCLMQYIGLVDKNGKEIYEGDILREPPKSDWDKINYHCFEVFFYDGDNPFVDCNIGYSMDRMHCHGDVCDGLCGVGRHRCNKVCLGVYRPSLEPAKVFKMEIIGNIFETPELLNK